MCSFSYFLTPYLNKNVFHRKIYIDSIPKLNWKISPPHWYTEQFVFQSFYDFFRILAVAQVFCILENMQMVLPVMQSWGRWPFSSVWMLLGMVPPQMCQANKETRSEWLVLPLLTVLYLILKRHCCYQEFSHFSHLIKQLQIDKSGSFYQYLNRNIGK